MIAFWLARFGTVVALTVATSCTGAGQAIAAGDVPHFHAMPCPARAQPDTIHVSWSIDTLPDLHRRGAETIHTAASIRLYYHAVCAIFLLKYDHLMVCACPAIRSIAKYHIDFPRR